MTLDQRTNSKLLYGLIASLILLIGLIFFYFSYSSENKKDKNIESTENIAIETPATPQKKSLEAETVASEPLGKPHQLITEDVLNAPIPENPSLAKEEVAKLTDIELQLQEQEGLLKAQHEDADALIKLKEEQIKLLEAQLAEAQ